MSIRSSAVTLLSVFLFGSLAKARVNISERGMPAELAKLANVKDVSKYLASPRPLRRLYAAMRLGQIGGPQAVQALGDQYGREYGHMLTEPRTTGPSAIAVMAHAFDALGRIGSAEARQALQDIAADITRRSRSGTAEARVASMAAPSLARALAHLGDGEFADRLLQEMGDIVPEDVRGEVEAKVTEAGLRRQTLSESEMIQQAFLSVRLFKPSEISSARFQQRVCHLARIILTFGSPTRIELRRLLEQLPESSATSQYLCSCSAMRSFFVEAGTGQSTRLTSDDRDIVNWVVGFWASLHHDGHLTNGPNTASDLLTHYLVEFRNRFADDRLKRVMDEKLSKLTTMPEAMSKTGLEASPQVDTTGPPAADGGRSAMPGKMDSDRTSSLTNRRALLNDMSKKGLEAGDASGEPQADPEEAEKRESSGGSWGIATLLVAAAFAVTFLPLLVLKKRGRVAIALAVVAALVLALLALAFFIPLKDVSPSEPGTTEPRGAEPSAITPLVEPVRDAASSEPEPPVATAPSRGPAGGLVAERVALLEAKPLGKEGRAVAQALGDLTLEDSAQEALPEDLRQRVSKAVDVIVAGTAAKTGQDRMAAMHQLERLWRLSADRLVENLDNSNMTVAEAAAKTLILMRNERIVRAIIEKVKTAEDERTRFLGVYTLGKMTEQRETIVENRECMSPERSARLASDVIIPFLEGLAKTEESERARKVIQRSLRELRESAGAHQ